ncbi:hypothetical protein ZOSMA_18G00040 [Zostera marina]|uniref:Small VCP/p97-interacting protein n=1 Tax=Zostera marina TaxID=29655 RepID=A0A0K9PRR0_ZOSMR|nr:hypothetical protein ZOSMA_18G00040 [Zostera marina]
MVKMGGCLSCFGFGQSEKQREEDRIQSEEARRHAAAAAEARRTDYERSAAGRAAKAQLAGIKKSEASANRGEPVLKWQMG